MVLPFYAGFFKFRNAWFSLYQKQLENAEDFLATCNCQRACNNCLKHYRNQYLQDNLDRMAALQLLEWGMDAKLPVSPPMTDIEQYFNSIDRLLYEEGIEKELDKQKGVMLLKHRATSKECIVHAAMKRMSGTSNQILVTTEALVDAKPFAINKIKEVLGIH